MKRLLSAVLVLALILGAMVLPVSASAASGSISAGAKCSWAFTYTYNPKTGNQTAYNESARMLFKNDNSKAITKFQVQMKFYNLNGSCVATRKGDWQETTVKPNKYAWTDYVNCPSTAYYFNWRLTYYLKGSSKKYTTSYMGLVSPFSNSNHEGANASAGKICPDTADGELVDNGANLKLTKFQLMYSYDINVNTGATLAANAYFRTAFKSTGSKAISKFRLDVDCYDKYGYYLAYKRTNYKTINLAKGKSYWTKWLAIPVDTDSVYYTVWYK